MRETETVAGAIGVAITSILVFIAAFLLGGWVVMLAVGVIHSWVHAVPTIGYATAVLVALFGRLALAVITPNRRGK